MARRADLAGVSAPGLQVTGAFWAFVVSIDAAKKPKMTRRIIFFFLAGVIELDQCLIGQPRAFCPNGRNPLS